MRHRKKGKKLGREKAARNALLKNLAVNLIVYEKIKTTLAKAKTVRPVVEKLITIAKVHNLTSQKKLASYLASKNAVKKALEVLGPRYKERKGGYTRIIRLGPRSGDGAEMVQIEFV